METKPDPIEVLAQWEADEKARRDRFGAPGLARPEQAQGKTGMQFF